MSGWVWRQVSWPRPLEWDTARSVLERLVTDPVFGHVVWETRARPGKVEFMVGAHPHHIERLMATCTDLVPGLRLTKPRTTRAPVTTATGVSVSHPHQVLDTQRVEAVTRAVFAGLNGLHKGEQLVLQLHIGGRIPAHIDQPHNAAGWVRLLTTGSPPPSGSAPVKAERRHSHVAKVCLRLGAQASTPGRARLLIMNLFGALRVTESAGMRLRVRPNHVAGFNQARPPWRYALRLSAEEIGSLVGWPIGPGDLPALPPLAPRHIPAPQWANTRSVTQTLRVFGRDTSEQAQPVGIPADDARLHTVLLGATGSGKSTAMLHLALADIRAGRSVMVIDPKTDLVTDLLERIPPERADDVAVLDPTDVDPVGLNPLTDVTRHPDLLVDTVMASFKALFADSWGVRTEEILTACLQTLVHSHHDPARTLVAIPSLLTNPALRRQILKGIDDPLGTGRFWAKYHAMSPDQQATVISPVLNKLSQFIVRPHMRAVLGQTTPRFDLADIFTKPRILLVALNKGILGPESARLLGSLIIAQLWPLILSRSRHPVAQRHTVSIYVDEVHDYLTSIPGDLADALAESRSLGVAWHLAHQYRTQLTPAMRAAIDTNARNKICFGLNATDARDMAKLAPRLNAEDFIALPRFGAYTNLTIGGRSTEWLSVHTLPPPASQQPAIEMRARSARRYGVPATATETALRALAMPPPSTSQAHDEPAAFGRKPAPSHPDDPATT